MGLGLRIVQDFWVKGLVVLRGADEAGEKSRIQGSDRLVHAFI